MQYIDIGLNLFCSQFHNPDAVLEQARKAGVLCILTGSDMEENARIDVYSRTQRVFGTCGIHPHNADRACEKDWEKITCYLRENPAFVAVGEVGLDYNRMFSEKDRQLRNLERHIRISDDTGKPMFLHERDAAQDMMAVFRAVPDICRRSVIHCFTGDEKILEQYLDMGFYIGITGWICDERRGADLQRAARIMPIDRVMLETDAPYLTPRGIPGLSRVNVPENVRYVARKLAQCMQVDEDLLRRHALDNTCRFFGIQAGNENET